MRWSEGWESECMVSAARCVACAHGGATGVLRRRSGGHAYFRRVSHVRLRVPDLMSLTVSSWQTRAWHCTVQRFKQASLRGRLIWRRPADADHPLFPPMQAGLCSRRWSHQPMAAPPVLAPLPPLSPLTTPPTPSRGSPSSPPTSPPLLPSPPLPPPPGLQHAAPAVLLPPDAR